VAKEERVAGEGTALAASSETGRERDNTGIEKDLAKDAREGNEDDEKG
jgi:hypothetical protein